MKKLLIKLYLILIILPVIGQDETSPLNIEALYVGEYFTNFSGGINTGATYLGLLDFGIGFNTEELGIWKNGEFTLLVENTHGARPSNDYIGDLQIASNIENGNFTYLFELWYMHRVNKLSIKFGLLDLNAECHVSEVGGLFFNSSFGIMPSTSLNMPAPIFPFPALGINLRYDISDKLSALAGVWDGDPGDFENNRYNINWSINNREGYLYMLEGEFNYSTAEDRYGKIKMGGLFHSGTFEHITDSTILDKGNLELHLIADHTLIGKNKGEKGRLDAFLQIGYLPDEKISSVPLYLGGGINYVGLLRKTADDILGVGLAYAGISNELTSLSINGLETYELALELSYSLPIFNNLTIQPDIQYIINPGVNGSLENAFIGFLRVIIEH